MGDAIVVEGQGQTIVIESDDNTDPVAHRALYLILEDYSQSQGFNVDILDANTELLAAADGLVAGGGTGQQLDGVEEVIKALDASSAVFSPDGFAFRDILGPLVDYQNSERVRAASSAAASSSAAARAAERAAAAEKERILNQMIRAEKEAQLDYDQAVAGRRIQAQIEDGQRARDAIGRNLANIARRKAETREQIGIQRDNLRLNTEGFERDVSLAGDPIRQLAATLGATGSPVQEFQNRVNQLEVSQDRELIANQNQALDLQERAQLAQLAAQQLAEQDRLTAIAQEEERLLLDYIASLNEQNRQEAAQQAIQDFANNDAAAQQEQALLDAVKANQPGNLTGGAAPPPTPDQAYNDAVSNPGTLDDVVNAVVDTREGSGGLYS